jgi:hypothetical protein
MVISTRTPEGEHNHCPVCGNLLTLEPSRPPGDAPCPFCGILLWFPSQLNERSLSRIQPRRSTVGRLGRRLGAGLRRLARSVRVGA